jgi:hypothetical protein
MFESIFKNKEKSRVFLGALAVVPRTDIKRYFEDNSSFEDTELDTILHQNLTEIFSLLHAKNVTSPMATDLVLDVVIPKFQSGNILDASLGDIGFPVFWRPKITLTARLYSLTSQKTKSCFWVTEKMEWRQYFRRILSWKVLFLLKPAFDQQDIELLLYQACKKILWKIQKSL